MIVEFLHRHRHLYSIERMRQVLNEHEYNICPATYYRYRDRGFGPTHADLEDAYAANRLYDLWKKNRRVYGRRKLWHAARRSGWDIGRDQVQRLMNIVGITGVLRKKTRCTTVRNNGDPRFADRIKRAWKDATHPNQWWVADFTYVYTSQGWVYASFVEDVYTREILGVVVDSIRDNTLVTRALEQALAIRKRQDPSFQSAGVIHHSDAGSQYTSSDLRELLLRHGMDGSIGTVGDAYDNGLMESAIGLYKSEMIDFDAATWRNIQDVETSTIDWVHWYNTHRLHSSIGNIPPAEKYTNHFQLSALEAA
ncbi:Integrase core domain protein [Corynebacterium cystitidis DSM 20524]|nr:Integrase core domain protein [Corynebacterium cystitidis DSM 20524]SNV88686.1 transposase IS3521 [Corynebacterium cystitidis]